MKRILFGILVWLSISSYGLYAQDGSSDTPDIELPEIDISIEDSKEFEFDLSVEEEILPDIEIEPVLKPEFGEQIMVDLEETLPEKIDNPGQKKPIDAIALFGYGLGNRLWIDTSIFVKDINPKLSLHYIRHARESYWIENSEKKTPSSLDHLTFQLFYNYKALTLYADLGYFGKTDDLQDQSIYETLSKRIINADFSPVLKLNKQNDLSCNILNGFIITVLQDDGENEYQRIDFDYFLNADFIYTQVFLDNHFFHSNLGYEFNIFTSNVEDTEDIYFTQNIFNTIKGGVGYSVILKDSFFFKTKLDFDIFFANRDFYFHILPYGKFAYNFKEYFSCHVEGGGRLLEKPGRSWFYTNDFTILPEEAVPGYVWFAKTGIKGAAIGWFSATADIEFAYNGLADNIGYAGFDWDLISPEEKIYTLEKRSYYELNTEVGFVFSVKNVLELTVNWKHRFLDLLYFQPRDELKASLTITLPMTGLSLFTNFTGRFLRRSYDGYLGNVYLLDAGIDWNFKERFGLGCTFTNILYFQHHELMQYYDEPGFGFIAYFKVGF